MSKYIVTMKSAVYGTEEFPRDTIKEAKATIARLKKKVKSLKDGIVREYAIELGGE